MAKSKNALTERHLIILGYLKSFQNKNGYPPTIRQIGEHINVKSTSQVTYYLKQLEKLGHILRDEHTSRSIRIQDIISDGTSYVVRKASEILQIPILGPIVASEPIPMPTSASGYFDENSTVEVASSLFSSRERLEELYALEVRGDSMIDAMVNDGDIVIMREAKTASNGEMVAVWIDGENTTTLKYFYKEKDRIRLQPANPTMSPIYIEKEKADSLRIMGKVVLVVRQIIPQTNSLTPIAT